MREQLIALVNLMVEQGVQYEDAVAEFEKRFIKRVLDNHRGNQTKTAEALGIHRNTLGRKLEELEFDHRPRQRQRRPADQRKRETKKAVC